MYREYFGLLDEPFRMTPDTRYLFRSARHEEAISSLLYGIGEKKGFIAITGEIGTGKTTLCRALLNQIDPKTKTAIILNPSLTATELLHSILDDLGIEDRIEPPTQKALLDRLNEFLIEQARGGGNVAVIIDEAQNLDAEVLEFIRLLSNLETEQEKLLQIILVGQPELNDILRLPKLEQLRQRIAVRYHITPLSREEIPQYIKHRLMVAGNENCASFDKGALDAIAEYTGGTPRLINIICDKCMLAAYACGKKSIDREIAKTAIRDHEGPDAQAAARQTAIEDQRRREAAAARSASMPLFDARPWVAAGLLVVVVTAVVNYANRDRAAAPPPTVNTPPPATAVSGAMRTAIPVILSAWNIAGDAKTLEAANLTSIELNENLAVIAKINLPALIRSEGVEIAMVTATATSYTFFDPTRNRAGEQEAGYLQVPRLLYDRLGPVSARVPLPAEFAYSSATPSDPRVAGLLEKALPEVVTSNLMQSDYRGREYSSHPPTRQHQMITTFQAAVGLPVDGILGPLTWCALIARAHPGCPSLAS